MTNDLTNFLSEIERKLSINVSVYQASGGIVYGQNVGVEIPFDFDGVFCDERQGYTFFKFAVRANSYVGVIAGASLEATRCAVLIAELAKVSLQKERDMGRTEFYKAVMNGELDGYTIERYAKKFAIKDGAVCVMLINGYGERVDEVKNVILNYGLGKGDFLSACDYGLAFVKFAYDNAGDYYSFKEYAEYIVRVVYEETGLSVQVALGGTVKALREIASSYEQAVSCARMVQMFGRKNPVHSFKEFMLASLLEDIPKNKLKEYLDTLLDVGAATLFEDKEMVSTAEEFLESSLNISETARNIYLHRNTLTYRLDKIEKETGLDIRKFSDALTFRLITLLFRLVK